MPESGAVDDLTWRDHWPAAVAMVAAALVALWARHHLYPALSWNRDEPVYLWHVEVLRAGQLTATDGGYPELFRPWLSALGDGVVYSQYTLGWPLTLLAANVLTGATGNALLLGAALAVGGTYALAFELFRSRRLAVTAAGIMVGSPILAIQGGVYLGYLFTLGLGLSFVALLLSGSRLRSRPRLITAGLALGWIFLTRPYDAVLWGAAAGLYLLIEDRGRAWRPLLVCGVASAPLVLATLLYNRHLTGSLLTFPISVADPLDTFGFGTKRLMPTFDTTDYTPRRALVSSAKNAALLPWFLFGSYLGLTVAGLGLWWNRRSPAARALLLLIVVFPVGYFPFWGTYLSSLASRVSGPIYFVPLFAPLSVLMAAALLRLWDERRRAAMATIAVLTAITVPLAWSRFELNQDISLRQEPWRRSVEAVEDALVLVPNTGPYLLYANPFSMNTPGLDGSVLYAVAGAPEVLGLVEAEADRALYIQQSSVAAPELGPREDPRDLVVSLTPARVVAGPRLDLTLTIDAPAGARFVSIAIEQLGLTEIRRVRSGSVTFRAAVDVADLPEQGTLGVVVGYGDTEAEAGRNPLTRLTSVHRTKGSSLEMLVPALGERYEVVDQRREWRYAPAVEVSLEVTPSR